MAHLSEFVHMLRVGASTGAGRLVLAILVVSTLAAILLPTRMWRGMPGRFKLINCAVILGCALAMLVMVARIGRAVAEEQRASRQAVSAAIDYVNRSLKAMPPAFLPPPPPSRRERTIKRVPGPQEPVILFGATTLY